MRSTARPFWISSQRDCIHLLQGTVGGPLSGLRRFPRCGRLTFALQCAKLFTDGQPVTVVGRGDRKSQHDAPQRTMREISRSQLAARCRNTQPDASHEPSRFELFRRAVVEGCCLCWQHLHYQYYPLVRYWVTRCASLDPDTIDDLTQDAFIAFWRSCKPDKLARARGLGAVLAYLSPARRPPWLRHSARQAEKSQS